MLEGILRVASNPQFIVRKSRLEPPSATPTFVHGPGWSAFDLPEKSSGVKLHISLKHAAFLIARKPARGIGEEVLRC